MIRILHITFDMRIGGTEMVIKNIIDGTNKQLFDMSVLCIESPLGAFSQDLINDNIQFYELNRQAGFDKTLIKSIRDIIKKNNIDIVHCHQYTPWVYGVIAALFTKTKVIFTEHGRFYPDSGTWKRKLINPILSFFTDKITVISQATKIALVEFENISKNRIDVIYNGITPLVADVKEFEKLRETLCIPNDDIILGTVARLDPIKNHKMMLEAFSITLQNQPNCTLIIVGDGEERQRIEQCIIELKIENKVILTGYEPKPISYIALMDIFLLSSLSEGTSMTLLEAMSLGKPCVVTDAGGNPEIIIDNYNGFVSKNDDAMMFSQCITSLLDSKLIGTFSANAKQRFRESFDEKIMNDSFNKIYSLLSVKRK